MAVMFAMAAMQLANGYFASQNVKATAELNREIAEMNAEFAELDAYDAEIEGYSAQARYQSTIDNTLAEQKTMMLAQDIDVSYGSAASIADETNFNGQLNMMEIKKQAQEGALGYTRQARDMRLNGSLAYGDAQAKASAIMGDAIVSATKTGLSGYKPRPALKKKGGGEMKDDLADYVPDRAVSMGARADGGGY